MDKTGTFLLGLISGAIALGVTAFLVDGLDHGYGGSVDSNDEASGDAAQSELQENIDAMKQKLAENMTTVKDVLRKAGGTSEVC